MTPSDWFGLGTDYGVWPFPRHHVRLPWLVVLLLAPPVILACAPLGTIAFGFIFMAWLATAPGLSLMALLDWSCSPLARHRPLARAAQAVARALIASLGGTGIIFGIWMLWRTIAGSAGHEVSALQSLLFAALALGMCLGGAQLAVLPYARLRRCIYEPGSHGA